MTSKKSSERVSFDDDSEHDGPQESSHWQSLDHNVETDELLRSMEDLTACFKASLTAADQKNEDKLAIWSCVAGYCEALATHKTKRYSIFPIPIDALRRLVTSEFRSFLSDLNIDLSTTPTNDDDNDNHHRDVVRTVANAIWQKAIPKPNIRDEVHANSLYVCLRGQIDKKSLDCFGASVVTIAALNMLGVESSHLCLSEDHAYERHIISASSVGTCEVAIPGNNKLSRSKRAKGIEATFEKTKKLTPHLTPETSWLYMASNPVVCDTIEMALVAVMGNINCTIEKKKSGYYLGSGQLYDLKRELLWILYDRGHMKRFPFGLLELGDCEEHRGSPRSSEWITVPDLDEPILVNEKLFRDAIRINREQYNEAQLQLLTRLFFSFAPTTNADAGHYHKDAGRSSADQEYRFVEAIKMYSQAARVTSKYPYEPGAIQLNKHSSAAAMLMHEDILTTINPEDGKRQPRVWLQKENAMDSCVWLLVFFDSLLFWEEQQKGNSHQHFVETLNPSHPHSIGKLLSCLPESCRMAAMDRLHSSQLATQVRTASPDDAAISYHPTLRSKRMNKESLLVVALKKPKVTIREMDLSMIFADDDNDDGGRRSKRTRRK
eukprot:scaffold5259_cov120-Cylindrotheca_fusiformis.AAC.5